MDPTLALMMNTPEKASLNGVEAMSALNVIHTEVKAKYIADLSLAVVTRTREEAAREESAKKRTIYLITATPGSTPEKPEKSAGEAGEGAATGDDGLSVVLFKSPLKAPLNGFWVVLPNDDDDDDASPFKSSACEDPEPSVLLDVKKEKVGGEQQQQEEEEEEEEEQEEQEEQQQKGAPLCCCCFIPCCDFSDG
jgi:hypothetical protein